MSFHKIVIIYNSLWILTDYSYSCIYLWLGRDTAPYNDWSIGCRLIYMKYLPLYASARSCNCRVGWGCSLKPANLFGHEHRICWNFTKLSCWKLNVQMIIFLLFRFNLYSLIEFNDRIWKKNLALLKIVWSFQATNKQSTLKEGNLLLWFACRWDKIL